MKKTIPLLLTAALLLSGCAKSADSADRYADNIEQKEITAAEILDKVTTSKVDEKMTVRAELGSDDFDSVCEKLYGVTADSLSDGGIIFEETGKSADEVSILKGADESVLRDRAEQRAALYEGYAPEEAEKARNAEVFTFEGFAVLVIADNASEIKKIITTE